MSPASYFTRQEFTCKCGRPECDALTDVAPALLERLNRVRELVGRPLTITSGLRCPVWNIKEGGVQDSEHLTGEAADVRCAGSVERYELLRHGFAAGFARIGVGKTFVHLDVSRVKVAGVIWLYA